MGDVGERTEEASALLPVMLMFCSWLERRLKLGAGESEEGWYLRVELAQETEAEERRGGGGGFCTAGAVGGGLGKTGGEVGGGGGVGAWRKRCWVFYCS